MAAIPVTIQGVLFYSDIGVGGGPLPGGPGGQPPGYWGGVAPPTITHPIAPGGRPPGFWGGVAPPYPDQGLPGKPPGYWGGVAPPYPDQGLPGRPPGIWGGAPSYPDIGGPGPQPIPTPPIYLPPGTIPGLKPEQPIYIPPSIWPNPGVPTHPIALPPPGSEEKPEVLENWDVVTAWTAQSGWIVAIVPSESHPGIPTPA